MTGFLQLSASAILALFFAGIAGHAAAGETDGTYEFRGEQLSFTMGEPNLPSRNVIIFLEGDGGTCRTHDPEGNRRLARTLSTQDHYVVAEGLHNRWCNQPEWSRLDFLHRVEETLSLIATLRLQYPDKRFFLWGHSGGSLIATLVAKRSSTVAGIVFMSGPSSELLWTELMTALRADYQAGQSQLVANRIMAYRSIEANCSANARYGPRSNEFWCQIFRINAASELAPLAANLPLLIVHGDSDTTVPVASAYQLYGRLVALGAHRASDLRVIPGAGHSYQEFLQQIPGMINRWISNIP